MSKTTTILSAAVLLTGVFGGLGVVMASPISVSASIVASGDGDAQLYENYYDDYFEMTRLNPSTGSVRLTLKVPEGRTLKRVVAARPGDDRYRLISELDELALMMLDGEVEGLELSEMPASEMTVAWNGWFDHWVGTWDDVGSEFLERNPADVIYIGLVMQDTKTGEETRSYHKVNYRSCAHEQAILSGEIIMCEAKVKEGRAVYLPESVDEVGTPPTWEEELATLAKKSVQEDFEALEALEAVPAEGGEIEAAQIEELEVRGEGMTFVKFPDIAEVKAVQVDYLARVEVLKRTLENEQETQEPVLPAAPGVTTAVSGVVEVTSSAGVQSNMEVQSAIDSQSDFSVQSDLVSIAEGVETETLMPEAEVKSENKEEDEQEKVTVPKLGGSWWERYGMALLIVGASLTGVIGWFLIGVLIKKRKRSER